MSSTQSVTPSTFTGKQAGVILFSILVVALCGIVYELIIGTVSSYLLGNSVYQFSFTIGFFMFAMGVGSLVLSHSLCCCYFLSVWCSLHSLSA